MGLLDYPEVPGSPRRFLRRVWLFLRLLPAQWRLTAAYIDLQDLARCVPEIGLGKPEGHNVLRRDWN